MATDTALYPDPPPMTIAELVTFTKKELDTDAESQAKLQANSAGELPSESQTGATLDLSHRNLHALPVEVIALIKDRVERLALSHNPQITIPIQIVQCERIRYLNIRWNQLTHFPSAILQLSKLEILDLSKNRIVSIPEDISRLTSLKFLAVARNRITRLPFAIGDMSSLGKLKFDENPIEFPPPEALKPPQESSFLSAGTQTSHDVCQNVKRYLRAAANRQRLRTPSEEELSESNVETPRPPKRSVTGGRFPIRPSISGIDNASELRSDSPSDSTAPPIPQRSHARVTSTMSTNTLTMKRPGIAPVTANGNDTSRSRSEMPSSMASLRQRRQGFVPIRKPTGDLNFLTEPANEVSSRLSQASTIKPTHSRATSSISTVNSYPTVSSGNTSSDAVSPLEGPGVRIGNVYPSSNSQQPGKKTESSDIVKGTKRLLLALRQLQRPANDVAIVIKDGTPMKSTFERQVSAAHAQVEELDRLLRRLRHGMNNETTSNTGAMKAIVRTSVRALKSYGVVAAALKRDTSRVVKFADGIYVRSLLFQTYATMVEVRNVCAVLGLKVKDRPTRKDTPRISQAWSSKSVTPTQPKVPINRRMRGLTASQSMASNDPYRVASPPPVPLNAHVSRSNTMTSAATATPRSGDSFALPAARPLARTNTMQSAYDLVENDEQFDRIFIKLKQSCDQAASALPHCRMEFNARRDSAQNAGQRNLAHHWAMALKKCEVVINHNKTLKKRLEVVKVNDPGIRYQRDFWQLCDAFVHSWADLATEIKDIGIQRVDITTIKHMMRNVQRSVKDVSKTISHSPLYHHAIGSRGPDSAGPQSLAPPFPPGLVGALSTHPSASSSQSSFLASGPATPLSAAIGPIAHSYIAPEQPKSKSRPATAHNTAAASGEGSHGHPSLSISTHERNDTVTQPPRPARRP